MVGVGALMCAIGSWFAHKFYKGEKLPFVRRRVLFSRNTSLNLTAVDASIRLRLLADLEIKSEPHPVFLRRNYWRHPVPPRKQRCSRAAKRTSRSHPTSRTLARADALALPIPGARPRRASPPV